MIQKVLLFFSTYNIIVGLIITLLALSSLEVVRSLSNDILLPIISNNIDGVTTTICNTTMRTGTFMSTLFRLFVAFMVILIIVEIHPIEGMTNTKKEKEEKPDNTKISI